MLAKTIRRQGDSPRRTETTQKMKLTLRLVKRNYLLRSIETTTVKITRDLPPVHSSLVEKHEPNDHAYPKNR